MKLLIIYTILFFIPTLSLGQRAKIAFEKTTFNLGLVQEDGGKVTREFKLTNKGKAPLLIKAHRNHVWLHPLPNGTGNPYFPGTVAPSPSTFNPKDRPGVFSKKIIVYTNATPPNIVLRLEGEVVAPPVDIPTTYPRRGRQPTFHHGHDPLRTSKKQTPDHKPDQHGQKERIDHIYL